VRFVTQIGYSRFSDFQQALRDYVDTGLTLVDRVDLPQMKGPGSERLHRLVSQEISDLKQFYETIDMPRVKAVADALYQAPSVYVVGSRLSYTVAYFLGWSLTKVRGGVHMLRGSDSTTLDWVSIAPADSLIVIIATSRYPNELLRVAKLVRRQDKHLVVIADSNRCPLNQFAHQSLVAPSRHIAVIGNPNTLSCLANFLVLEVASRDGQIMKTHQETLEQTYRENDVLFNLSE